MKAKSHKILFFSLLLLWFVINLIQAYFTEIISDEAYYNLYGKYLAWGYYDHPPLIALLIKISSFFFKGTLGIRSVTVLMQTLTIVFIWKLIDEAIPDRDKVINFFIIVGSICMFSFYGFFTTPDVPLIFFTAFFLYSYKNYLADQSLKNILTLSISMAGLVYSKYHAILVIGFVVLSNPGLLKSYKIWLAGFCAIALLMPHIFWQFTNDFPSLRFQLVGRSESFRWVYLLEYLPNQMAVFNPLAWGAVFYIAVRHKPANPFDRALYFLIYGFTGFFALMALRGHVEPHWTIAISIPVIILIYKNGVEDRKMFWFIRKGLLIVVILILICRVLLISNFPFVKSLGFNGKQEVYEHIQSVAKDLPVVFPGSYQDPALYSFFTGKEAFPINSIYSRETQFDIWQKERLYDGKKVFVYGFDKDLSLSYKKDGLVFSGYIADSLQTVNRVDVIIDVPASGDFYAGDTLNLPVHLKNLSPFDIDFNHSEFPVNLCMVFIRHEDIKQFPLLLYDPVKVLRSGETVRRTFRISVPDLREGRYHFGICLKTRFGPAINNSFSVIRIKRNG